MVIQLVKVHGPKKWSLIAESLPGRIGKQCRERCDGLFACFALPPLRIAHSSPSSSLTGGTTI